MTEVAELTRELVAIPSHGSEAAVGDAIEAWLREHTDAAVTRDGAGAEEGRGGNVIARKGDGDPTLALVGHHDVVPPDDGQVRSSDDGQVGTPDEGRIRAHDSEVDASESDDGVGESPPDESAPDGGAPDERESGRGAYVVAERDGRLYGRGTADMKGAVAAMLLAFRDSEVRGTSGSRTQSGDADPAGELVFASFVGEEVGGVGARHAIDAGFAPDLAVVGEGSTGYSAPGVTDVAVAHKGRRGSTVVARGTAAHASEPAAGENAIYRAADAVDVLRELDAPAVEVAGERVEGSVVATTVEGGSAWNVVPDRCAVTVDERTVPVDEEAVPVDERAVRERAGPEGQRGGGTVGAPLERVEAVPGVEWTVDQDLPPMRCRNDAFADAVLAAADAAQGGAPEHVVKPHATDAGWLAGAGVDCVVCGPAEPGEAHTADESVSLAALARCREAYRRVAEAPYGD